MSCMPRLCREDDETACLWGDGDVELREMCMATLGNIVQVPQEHQVAVGDFVNGVEVQLETLSWS